MTEQTTEIKLQKHEELEVSKEAPWVDDYLDREKAGKVLGQVLQTIEQPFVIAINSPFGTGKSFFVNRLVQQFQNEGQVALYFNAWEKDNQSQPLLSFVGEIQKQFSKNYGISKTRKSMKAVVKGAGNIALGKGVPALARIFTAGVLGDDDIKALGQVGQELISGAGNVAEGLVQKQADVETAFEDFRKDLEKAAADALDKAGEQAKAVYVFVDELDRCRPPYALELLENIKHLFSVQGIVFILAIDRNHLKNSISTIYGAGMDSEGYLARFIDQNYYLPGPSREAYARFLSKRFGFSGVLDHRREGQNEREGIIGHFSEASELFSLSLRHQEQAFAEMNFVVRSVPQNWALFAPLLALLSALKRWDHELYEEYCKGRKNWDDLVPLVSRLPLGNDWLNSSKSLFSRAWLLIGNQTNLQHLRETVQLVDSQLNNLSKVDPVSHDATEKRIELEAKRALFEKADQIARYLSSRYNIFEDIDGSSPAKILYKRFALAAEFSSS